MCILGRNLGMLVWKHDLRYYYSKIGYSTEMFITICNTLLRDVLILSETDCCRKCHLQVLICFVKMHYLEYYDSNMKLVRIPTVDLSEPLD